MKKIFLAIMLLATLLFAGCGPQELAKDEGKGETLYTVKDATGTELRFTKKPQRIVSLNVSADEILLDLLDGETQRLAALSRLADDEGICGAGEKVKQVQGRAESTNLEAVLSYQPDLVIIPDYSMEPVRGLRSAGMKVYVCHTPNDMQGILQFIQEIGAAVGEADKGKQMAEGLQKQLDDIREKALQAAGGKQQKVLALSFTGSLGMKGTFSDVCHYAGVRNALEGVDIPYQSNLSEEKMLELNPDLILTPSWDYSKKGDPDDFRRRILENPTYKDMNAVKNKQVFKIHDNYLYSTSQYTVKAVEELAQLAYPEAFK